MNGHEARAPRRAQATLTQINQVHITAAALNCVPRVSGSVAALLVHASRSQRSRAVAASCRQLNHSYGAEGIANLPYDGLPIFTTDARRCKIF
jgi:hypothetical protein